jgi:hypothetical protein
LSFPLKNILNFHSNCVRSQYLRNLRHKLFIASTSKYYEMFEIISIIVRSIRKTGEKPSI